MRKIINTSALIFFVWLVLDAFQVPKLFMNFILVGELPGSNVPLSPNTMLIITTLFAGVIMFELAARHFGSLRTIRYYFTHLGAKRQHLPRRRFGRI